MSSVQNQKHFRVCNLCEAMCGLEIEHDGEKVIKIRGDQKDPVRQRAFGDRFSQKFLLPEI